MLRFILLTFAFLGWTFYALSGGADYHPREGSRQAEALKARKAAETRMAEATTKAGTNAPLVAVGTAAASEPDLPDVVTKASVDVQDIGGDFTALTRAAGVDEAKAVPLNAVDVTEADQPATENARLANLSLAEPAAFAQAAGYAPISEDAREAAVADTRDLRRITGTSVNMRAGPGTGYGVLTRVTRGTEVEVLETYSQGWLRLRVLDNQRVGWVYSSLVSDDQG